MPLSEGADFNQVELKRNFTADPNSAGQRQRQADQ
jgi:hypothetical protein